MFFPITLIGILAVALLVLLVEGEGDEIAFAGTMVMIFGAALLIITSVPSVFGG